jgi:hypothetical protein
MTADAMPDTATGSGTQGGAAGEDPQSRAKEADELDLSDRDARDQSELSRAQQEYELSATGA